MSNVLKIDELLIGDHYYLGSEDECYYHMEYSSRQGYEHSKANNLIHNFKKPVKYKGQAPWKYKLRAIRELGDLYKTSLTSLINLSEVTLVPIPPSKMKTDPEYDDRMLRLLTTWTSGQQADIRELLVMRENIEAAHERTDRLPPDELEELMEINPDQRDGLQSKIILLDDVLTTGAHYVACRRIIQREFPGTEVIGVFAARTIRPKPEDVFDDLFNFDEI